MHCSVCDAASTVLTLLLSSFLSSSFHAASRKKADPKAGRFPFLIASPSIVLENRPGDGSHTLCEEGMRPKVCWDARGIR